MTHRYTNTAHRHSRTCSRTAAGAYALWGAIHVWVGSTVIAKAAGPQPHEALRFLADARPDSAPLHFAPAAVGLAEQHGWNLLWIGATVASLAWPILKGRAPAAAWAFALAGLADIG